MKNIKEYTTEEITEELSRRLALDAKKLYEVRTAITNHIRKHIDVYLELADIIENKQLKEEFNKIKDLIYECVEFLCVQMKDFLSQYWPSGASSGSIVGEIFSYNYFYIFSLRKNKLI